ncbi:MAG: HlyD family efflux transporter periplasmic adaptor subunit [Gammaproteobacteria bacterium]
MATIKLKGIADLLVLQQKLRRTPSLQELYALLVNDTRLLFPYRTAMVWTAGKITAVSGLPTPIKDAPFTRWVERLCKHLDRELEDEITPVQAGLLKNKELTEEWADYLPAQLLWIPLLDLDNQCIGVLLLAREEVWAEEEIRLLTNWAGAAAHAMEALQLRKVQWWQQLLGRQRKRTIALLLVGVAVLFLLPVRISVVAPAEVVPSEPLVVRAPLAGVIGEVHVRSNQNVAVDQPLLNLDETSLRSRLEVAAQELNVARAEYLRAEQASIRDRDASAQMQILRSRIEQRDAEVKYVEELIDRAHVKANASGVVIIEEISELEGRPVSVGEQILTIADPERVELEVWLPVDDSLPIEIGSAVNLYLNVSPGEPVPARVLRSDYQARVSPDGMLAFRVRAEFVGQLPRIGLRGTARVYGERVSLYYYFLRKPLAALRRIAGI